METGVMRSYDGAGSPASSRAMLQHPGSGADAVHRLSMREEHGGGVCSGGQPHVTSPLPRACAITIRSKGSRGGKEVPPQKLAESSGIAVQRHDQHTGIQHDENAATEVYCVR